MTPEETQELKRLTDSIVEHTEGTKLMQTVLATLAEVSIHPDKYKQKHALFLACGDLEDWIYKVKREYIL